MIYFTIYIKKHTVYTFLIAIYLFGSADFTTHFK